MVIIKIFLNFKDYEEISSIIYNFLKEIYDQNYIKEDCLPISFKLLFDKKLNPKIQDLIFSIIKKKNEDDEIFTKIIDYKFCDTIKYLLIKENKIEIIIDIFHLIQNLTKNFAHRIEEIKLDKLNLTKFLKDEFSIGEISKEIIEKGKNLINKELKLELLKTHKILIYEWLNKIFRFIFIALVDSNSIKEISLIDPYKNYDEDFVNGVIYLIYI